LICYGGAGGLHATDLARALDMSQVIVPVNPGAFSALGVLLSDIVKDVSQSVLLPVPVVSEERSGRRSWARFISDVGQRFARLERPARVELRKEGFKGEPAIKRELDLRYAGQSYELTVPFHPAFREAFHREHERTYGHSQPDRPIEIVSVRLRLVIGTPKPMIGELGLGTGARARADAKHRTSTEAMVLNRRPVWFGKQAMDTAFYDRPQLGPGIGFSGPAIVLEYGATTVVPPDFRCRVDGGCNLILEKPRE
jgi:N-methylhydantoinase A